MAESTLFVHQHQALERLSLMVAKQEQILRATAQQRTVTLTPALARQELWGIQDHVETVADRLLAPRAPWLLALEGIGGIGKTTLAGAVLDHLAASARFAGLAWVSAQTEAFDHTGIIRRTGRPALTAERLVSELVDELAEPNERSVLHQYDQMLSWLKRRLRAHEHLVVVDNLETTVDVEALLPLLGELAQPSKFLLTSRKSYYHAPEIYHFPVPELSESNALALVHHVAAGSNLQAVAGRSDQQLHPIYDAVGGNPLALRLVVGQMHVHPLADILADLEAERGESMENLYTYVYRRAWDGLDEGARQVLLVMPLVGAPGEDAKYPAQISDLPPDVVRRALERLVTLNLVNVVGDMESRRYTIHSLTRTFLLEQVANWM